MQAAATASLFERLFGWAEKSDLGNAVRASRIAFPIVEMGHLLGLSLLLGSVLILNARFFGMGMRRQTTSELASDFAPWTRIALLLMLISGIPMFASKANDLWERHLDGWTIKVIFLVAAILFHYTVLVPLARKDNIRRGRWAAAVSLILWFGTALSGLSLEFL